MTLRASILLALAFTLCSPAFASTWPASIFDGAPAQAISEVRAHQDLASEAESYLYSCDGMGSDMRKDCLYKQFQFIMDYMYAIYNEDSSQQNIAFNLSGDGEPPRFTGPDAGEPGININLILGCAWREAVIIAGSAGFMNDSLDEYTQDCDQISEMDQNAAKAIAYGKILPEIESHLLRGDAPIDIYTGYKAGEAPRGP